MGALGTDSTSNSYDERQATSGAASPNVRGANPIAFGDNSLSVGARATVLLPGATQYGNLTAAKGATINVTNSDPQVLQSILDNATGVVAQSTESVIDYLTKSTQAASANQDQINQELSSLAESQQTGGQSDTNKTLLYIVLGVAGAVAAIFIFGRK